MPEVDCTFRLIEVTRLSWRLVRGGIVIRVAVIVCLFFFP
jgi:hypothetical protein